jgi:aspartyl-tRNA(Asn)/glutamyl-tRNA(Gln) amidotransferase subunit A
MTDLTQLSLTDVIHKLNSGEVSAVDLTQAYLNAIDQQDKPINSYITVLHDEALAQAQQADEARATGDPRPLLGVPIGIKDVLSTKGVQTTCGSKILAGYKPSFDATCVARLNAAGTVTLGKTNMDEFAMGSSNENSAYGLVRNPWSMEHVPGGSSGGSAAAVAAGLCAGSLGTDTGGSVRLPASYCGITALKPTYGRISRYGLIAFGSSLDCVGPMARTAEDTARLLHVMAGHDPMDSTSMQIDVPDYVSELTGDVKGLKVGLPKEYFSDAIDPEVTQAVRTAIAQLEAMGADVQEVSLPYSDYSLAVYYIIATSEASSNLARFDGIRYGPRVDRGDMWDTYRATRAQFGDEVKRRIMLGTYALSAGYYDAYYGKAQAVRTLIKQEFEQAFESVDVILTPTAPNTAVKLGENIDDPLQAYLADVLTVGANLAGIPALALPCGFSTAGMPIGMQIMGPQFAEAAILKVGHAYQQVTEWHRRVPEPVA